MSGQKGEWMARRKKESLSEVELQKIKEMKRAYHREWSKKNPEKVKAYIDRYWLKKARQQMQKDVA